MSELQILCDKITQLKSNGFDVSEYVQKLKILKQKMGENYEKEKECRRQFDILFFNKLQELKTKEEKEITDFVRHELPKYGNLWLTSVQSSFNKNTIKYTGTIKENCTEYLSTICNSIKNGNCGDFDVIQQFTERLYALIVSECDTVNVDFYSTLNKILL